MSHPSESSAGSPLDRSISRVFSAARLIGLAAWRGVGELYDSEGLTHAASIAYYALLSLFPFLLLVLSIIGSFTSDPSDRDAVVKFVFRYFPRQFDFMTRQLDAFRGQTVQLGVGGLLALVWASLGVFNAISSAVNHAWGVERRRSFLMHGFVALIFYFIPNTEMRFRYGWPGAILTGLLWRGALAAFSWYARDLARWNVVHGSIAAVVIFLLWIYVSAVILLYGVEMTAAYARLQTAAIKHPALAGQVEPQAAA